MQNFRALGAPSPDSRASGGWPDPHKQTPIANFWLRACLSIHLLFSEIVSYVALSSTVTRHENEKKLECKIAQ